MSLSRGIKVSETYLMIDYELFNGRWLQRGMSHRVEVQLHVCTNFLATIERYCECLETRILSAPSKVSLLDARVGGLGVVLYNDSQLPGEMRHRPYVHARWVASWSNVTKAYLVILRMVLSEQSCFRKCFESMQLFAASVGPAETTRSIPRSTANDASDCNKRTDYLIG
jgi:hypothetical protein